MNSKQKAEKYSILVSPVNREKTICCHVFVFAVQRCGVSNFTIFISGFGSIVVFLKLLLCFYFSTYVFCFLVVYPKFSVFNFDIMFLFWCFSEANVFCLFGFFFLFRHCAFGFIVLLMNLLSCVWFCSCVLICCLFLVLSLFCFYLAFMPLVLLMCFWIGFAFWVCFMLKRLDGYVGFKTSVLRGQYLSTHC